MKRESSRKLVTCLLLTAAFFFSSVPSYAVFIEPQESAWNPGFDPGAAAQAEQSRDEKEPLPYVPGEVLFKLKPSYSLTQTAGLRTVRTMQFRFGGSRDAGRIRKLIETKPSLQDASAEPVFKSKRPSGAAASRLKSAASASAATAESLGLERWMKLKFAASKDAAQPSAKTAGSGKTGSRTRTAAQPFQQTQAALPAPLPEADIASLCREIMATGEAEHCQPNYLHSAHVLPNDTYIDPDQDGNWETGAFGQTYEDLWGLKMVQGVEAWSAPACSGNCMGENVVAAVVDSGLDSAHADISGQVWANPGETPGNGIDDDSNGFVDDVSGWDFVSSDNIPQDGYGHGTHVSGTIAAVAGNSAGIAGVAPAAKILPVKGLSDAGSGTSANLAAGLQYAADMGARVINNSWGCNSPCPSDPVVEDAVTYAYGLGSILVFSAGNADDDVANYSPQNMNEEVIVVAAVNHLGEKASFSNYGTQVDISAPGGGDPAPPTAWREHSIISLIASGSLFGNSSTYSSRRLNSEYMRLGGTSMAAPHAAGAIALLLGNNPSLSQAEATGRITASANTFDPLPDVALGSGIVNAYEAQQLGTQPAASIVFYKKLPAGQYIVPAVDWELSFRVAFSNLSTPFNATLNTTHPDIQVTQAQKQFVQEGVTVYANNDAATFRLQYTGSGPAFLGDIPFDLAINGTGINLSTTISFGIIYLPGWPQNAGDFVDSSPALVDLDGNGLKEVIIGGSFWLDDVHAWNPDGTPVPGWPKAPGSGTESSPAVGNLDQAGNLEVVIGEWGSTGDVDAWHDDGTNVIGWPKETNHNVLSSPAMVDLDGTGTLEVVIGSVDKNVYAWHADGTDVPGWPITTGDSVVSSPAVADLDRVGELEVVVMSDDAFVHAWHADGTVVAGWPVQIGIPLRLSSPAIADLDGVGNLEVVIGSSDNNVYAWHADGTLVTGWPQATGGIVDSSPAIADLDRDGILEVIVGSFDDKVYAWRADGTPLAGWPVTAGGNIRSSPAIADLDWNGTREVVVSSWDDFKVYAWHYDGTPVAGFPLKTGLFTASSPAIADIDGNGTLEIAVGSRDERVHVWTLPWVVEDTAPWPMFRQNLENTGFYTCPAGITCPVPSIISVSVTPAGWPIGEVAEGQSVSSPGFTVTNDGNVAETFTLSIQNASSPSSWLAGSSAGADTYVMRGLFGPAAGDPTGLFASDDVVLIGSPSPAGSTQFGDPGLIPNGANVDVDSSRGLWFQFEAPASTSAGGIEQSITIVVGAEEGIGGGSDSTPPTGSIVINGGAAHTSSPDLAFALTGSDPESGLGGMRFSDDGGTSWTSWEPFQTARNFTLSAGDGTREVTLELINNAGLIAAFSDTIILDTAPPSGIILINNDDPETPSANVTLTLSASDNVSQTNDLQMAFSEDGISFTPFEPFQSTRAFTLSGPNGTKTVTVRYQDEAGNSQDFSDSIELALDTVPPTGSVVINNDDPFTNSPDVVLTLTGSDDDSGLDAMRFSTDGGTSWTSWEPFATSKALTLPAQDGTREVRFELRDLAGNSAVFSDTILLDQPPEGTISIEGGATHTNTAGVTLTLDVTDQTTPQGNIQMAFSEDGISFTPFEPFAASKPFTLSGTEGTKTVTVRYQDEAGNTQDVSDTIILDTTPPTGTILINNDDAETSSANVTLTLSASDNLSQTNDLQMAFSEDGIGFTPFEPFQSSRAFTLTGPEGTKTVTVRYQDEAGNAQDFSDDIILTSPPPPPVPVTFNGDAAIDNTQFKFGGGSVVLDGAGDYLSVPSSTDWDFGTGDFTVDFWVRFNSGGTTEPIDLINRNDTQFRIGRGRVSEGGTLVVYLEASQSLDVPWNPSNDVWYHIAVTRSGTDLRAFVNGAQSGATATNTSNISDASALEMGRNSTGIRYHDGHIDELRLSKGAARWTSNFTPPSSEYTSDGNTVLLLHLNTAPPPTVTFNGDAAIDNTQFKFGGGSVVLDGAGDYLSVPDSEDWNFGTGDFTVDFWVRFNNVSINQGFFRQLTGGGNDGLAFIFLDSNALRFDINGNETILTAAWTPSVNTWYHLAIVRDGLNSWRLFINGVEQAASTSTSSITNSSADFEIGLGASYAASWTSLTSYDFNGWFDEFRISKGVARWTSNFTPPSSEYASDGSTVLLLHLDTT